jgi:AcrR family transcriptional regulator
MKTNTRQQILQRAGQLFLTQGLATGIDHITRECDTAKMTIYTHFTSKDGLIGALLEGVAAAITEKIRTITAEPGSDPQSQLEAVFNMLCHGMSDPDLRIGLGVRALVEFPRPDHPAHIAGLKLQRAILAHLEPLCARAGLVESESAARHLLLIAQGSFIMAPALGTRGSNADAAALFQILTAQSADPVTDAGH